MKKTMRKLTALFAVLVLVLSMTACGGSSSADTGTASADYAGTYNLTSLTEDGEDYIEMLTQYAPMLGIDAEAPIMTMELTADGTFTMTTSEDYSELLDGQFDEQSGTYTVDSTTITLSADGDEITGTIEDGVITVGDPDSGIFMGFTAE